MNYYHPAESIGLKGGAQDPGNVDWKGEKKCKTLRALKEKQTPLNALEGKREQRYTV
jgi:hypothetical protein